MSKPTYSLDFSEVGIGILVIDFQDNIFISSDGFQNLLKKFPFNLRHHTTLYNRPLELRGQADSLYYFFRIRVNQTSAGS
jgi:hypothetical protein